MWLHVNSLIITLWPQTYNTEKNWARKVSSQNTEHALFLTAFDKAGDTEVEFSHKQVCTPDTVCLQFLGPVTCFTPTSSLGLTWKNMQPVTHTCSENQYTMNDKDMFIDISISADSNAINHANYPRQE